MIIAMALASRYEPCNILREHGIPCLVYFEDAIAAYGVPTALFDLYLLVPDLVEAEGILEAKGWSTAPPFGRDTYHFLNAPTYISHRRLVPPASTASLSQDAPPGPTTTVLLPAAAWGASDIEQICQTPPQRLVPPLPVLLDGLIKTLLDLPPFDWPVRDHLATHISYLYGHCVALKDQDFAGQLKLEHRQFHYDALSKPGLGTVPFTREQRRIRDEIRSGRRVPQRNSWYLSPGAAESS